MKKLLAALFILIVVAGAGGFFYVTSIDWNKHKEIIAQQFFEVTGKRIVFSGPISFEIFPSPYLQAKNVKIINDGTTEKPLLEAEDLVAKLDLNQLLHKQFNVKQMELKNPQINFELQSDGRLNWQSNLSSQQKQKLEDAKFALNSVRLDNATFKFEDISRNIIFEWDNLNGEVIAQSINGPFRLEGNYIKDNNPQGVAISIGKFSDTTDTSLNMVMTHPVSESYVRFDGSFMLKNRVVNGNFILEAKNLHDFVAANISNLDLDEHYNKPLAVSTDINLNKEQLSLLNMVVKYGETQGAGNLRMPLITEEKDGDINPRVELAFDFTDLDLTPIVEFVKERIQFYAEDGNEFAPDFKIDLLADLNAVRTMYDGQPVKNFKFSADLLENILTINELSAVIPGDTSVDIKGLISAYEGEPFYDLETSINSTDFLRMLNWLKIEPNVVATSTYKKAAVEAKVTGSLKKIYLSPVSVTLDKSSFSGEAEMLWGSRKELVLNVDTDMINFDNYIPPLPEEILQKNWQDRMKYQFSRLGWLNDADIKANVKMNLALFGGVPFEKVSLNAEVLNGKMDLKNLSIASVMNAKFNLSGKVFGFGEEPGFEDFNYKMETNNLEAFLNKLEAKTPSWNFKKIEKMALVGALNGNLNHVATQTKINAGEFNISYTGQIKKEENQYNFIGELELKHPDFVKMLNELNIKYVPQNNMMGLINLKTNFVGNADRFRAEELKANIGFNSFSGKVNYDKGEKNIPNVFADLEVNKFEIERFLNKEDMNTPKILVENREQVAFLANPMWGKNKVNYDGLKGFSLIADLKVKELSYFQHMFTNAQGKLSIFDGNIALSEFGAEWLEGKLNANLNLDGKTAKLNGNLNIKDADTDMLSAQGKTYGISKGNFDLSMKIDANAESEATLIQSLKANTDFKFTNAIVKGFNLVAIYDDIVKRESSEGLAKVVEENLISGSIPINILEGKATIADGNFILQNAQMLGNNWKMMIQGEGNLIDWTMNTKFDVKYIEPKYLPMFAFDLKGGMDNPTLSVNVNDLFEMYKSGEEKREAAVKTAEENKQKRLKDIASERKKTTEILLAEIQKQIEPEVVKAHKEAINSISANVYADILKDINNMVADLVQNALEADTENLDEKVLAKLKHVNDDGKVRIETVRKKLANAQLDEEKSKTKVLYEDVSKIYDDATLFVDEYKNVKKQMYDRLAKIVTNFEPKADANIVGWENFIEDKITMFEITSNPMMKDYEDVLVANGLGEISDYNVKIKELKDDLYTDLQSVKQSITEYAEYMNRKISGLEKQYEENLRAKEVQQKLEKTKGSISIKKSGKTLAVSRDIEDIEKAEEMIEDKEVKVLDFMTPKSEAVNRPQVQKKNVIKKGRVTLN